MEFRRKLYTRGSSFETTIPTPLLFTTDKKKKYDVVFTYIKENEQWIIKIEERRESEELNKK
jgi:hypothetical protein